MGGDVIAQTSQLGDKPKIEQVLGLIKNTIDSFISKDIDEVYIVYNKFINTVSQEPIVQKVLPIQTEDKNEEYDYYWDYLYEPDAEAVLESLFTRYIDKNRQAAITQEISEIISGAAAL